MKMHFIFKLLLYFSLFIFFKRSIALAKDSLAISAPTNNLILFKKYLSKSPPFPQHNSKTDAPLPNKLQYLFIMEALTQLLNERRNIILLAFLPSFPGSL